MAPFALEEILGKAGAYAIYLTIGFAFGSVLEMAGFGASRRLAAQFYLRNMTVLKVMFTAIVVAMTLIFLFSSLDLLDYNRLWVNPTYLAPGILGGLIMGLGFIIGGFCPGTSLVAVATFKVDGLFFFLGAGTGGVVFGETIDAYQDFFRSTSLGRFTLPEWLGIPTGWVVLLVVLMALFMFWGAEKLERLFGRAKDLPAPGRPRRRLGAAAALVVLALATPGLGQPSVADRWESVAEDKQPLLDTRAVQIHPGELVDLDANELVRLVVLDVRDESEFNVFHLTDARRVDLDEIADGLVGLELLSAPPNTVSVVVSNDERRASEAWKLLVAQSVLNVYILEGGMNGWLELFGHVGHEECMDVAPSPTSTLRHRFETALGSTHESADPDSLRHHGLDYTKKVELQTRKTLGGGCG